METARTTRGSGGRAQSGQEGNVPARRMLLVDDDPFFLKLGQSLLGSDAYEVLTAANGAEGLRVARTALPDAVLLDVALPDLDGFEVCRRLKEDPLTAAIPVILLTGKSIPELNKKGFEVGAVATVRKEVTTPRFLNTLRVVLTTPLTERTAPRVSVALPVTYECADRVGTGETVILSHRGMFVSTPDPPEVGAHLLLHFALPGSEVWESNARVVWTRRPEEEHPYPVGMGVKFLELPPGAQTAIAAFVASLPATP